MHIGQAVNAGDIRRGLLTDSAYTPRTGTATGDRAASDFAKGMQFSNVAQVNRDLQKSNAQAYGQRQRQGEEMAQQWGRAQMDRFRSRSGQRSRQSSLAMKLLEDHIGMSSDLQTRLIGMLQ
jgi:hypothetical protein